MNNTKPKPIRFTQLAKDGDNLVEKPYAVNAEAIVDVSIKTMTRTGVHIIGSPRERVVTIISNVTNPQGIAVIESFEEVFAVWQAASGLDEQHVNAATPRA